MLIIALALLSHKLDDPRPASTKLADPPAWTARVLPVSLREEAEPEPKPEPPPAPPVKPVAPKPPAASPQMWQLADRSGQRWQHTDPRWLQTWVNQRNAVTAQPRYYAPVLQYGSPCANGACPR